MSLEIRKKYCERLIGRTVEVHALGTIDPTAQGDVVWVPLPEYGIGLLWRRPVNLPTLEQAVKQIVEGR